MSEECVVIRRARAVDEAARAAVIRDAYKSNNFEAFLYFFFHEVTLQAVVLCGAGLFIFFGCGLGAMAALPVLAGAAVLLAVSAAHELAAARQARLLLLETAGWVAEHRGPQRAPGHAPPSLAIRPQEEGKESATRGRLVGTVSLSECRDAAGAWLHAWGVSRAWQRRGVGRALEEACRDCAARTQHTLHAVTSALQPGARALLHDAGWQCAGAYARPLLGAALALPLARLTRDPPAPA